MAHRSSVHLIVKLITCFRALCIAVLLLVVKQHTAQTVTEIKTVSQCYDKPSSSSMSPSAFVTLYCGHRRLIAVRRVVHGSRPQRRHAQHCGFIDGDCLADAAANHGAVNVTSTLASACDGRQYCVQTVGVTPAGLTTTETNCGTQTPAYLMIFYECLWEPETTTAEDDSIRVTVVMPSTPTTGTESQLNDVIDQQQQQSVDICSNYSGRSVALTMTSPGFPGFYPDSVDCRCIVRAKPQSKVTVTYTDIELTMTDQLDQCVDWLLLQSIGHRNSAAMTCGHLSGAQRVIASRGNQLLLHFHTAPPAVTTPRDDVTETEIRRHDNDMMSSSSSSSSMKGFKILLQADPVGEFRLNCHLAAPDLLNAAGDNNYYHGSLARNVKSAASPAVVHRVISCPSLVFVVLVSRLIISIWR